jgi:hypothetical protein
MAREPEERQVASDACITLDGVKYQLTEAMAGEKVIVLYGLFDTELHVEFKGQKHGPFYPASGPIPLNAYRPMKKSRLEKQIDKVEALAKHISLPRSVLTGQLGSELKLIQHAKLVSEERSQPFVPFENNDSEMAHYKTKIEAKLEIARFLGRPLATLPEGQRQGLDQIVDESLHKMTVLSKVREFFQLKCVSNQI